MPRLRPSVLKPSSNNGKASNDKPPHSGACNTARSPLHINSRAKAALSYLTPHVVPNALTTDEEGTLGIKMADPHGQAVVLFTFEGYAAVCRDLAVQRALISRYRINSSDL